MRIFEAASSPAVRSGEFDLGGRRVAVRALAYAGEAGPPRFRFDPLGRALVARSSSGTLVAGPSDPAEWTAAFARAPAGPALIEGAAFSGEGVRGSYRAAAEGSIASGRGTYLLDPSDEGLPPSASARAGARPPAVALFAWAPERDVNTDGLQRAREREVVAGIAVPLIPSWTSEEEPLDRILGLAAASGAVFALPIAPAGDAESRRLAVDARTAVEPEALESFFDAAHHRAWETDFPDAMRRFRRSAARAGISVLPPRPASPIEPRANAQAADRLESGAAGESDEHRASRLHAAVRWIDAFARDLAPVVRDGNFLRVFPLGEELGREVESILREELG